MPIPFKMFESSATCQPNLTKETTLRYFLHKFHEVSVLKILMSWRVCNKCNKMAWRQTVQEHGCEPHTCEEGNGGLKIVDKCLAQ